MKIPIPIYFCKLLDENKISAELANKALNDYVNVQELFKAIAPHIDYFFDKDSSKTDKSSEILESLKKHNITPSQIMCDFLKHKILKIGPHAVRNKIEPVKEEFYKKIKEKFEPYVLEKLIEFMDDKDNKKIIDYFTI
ncbi:MAG: hypothetical protein PHT91_02065 [Candidatus Nanoarchaeia archaeon]|nr:hypothetical protein [Candidatus Nanoarchaeia archaeon]MDD5053974.1 hypothetical protein [Candidatus Nanoarchaeia archaeon]MDD5499639.1 hypothetical protein [Candidatus Nanoarchaeia archaeon]